MKWMGWFCMLVGLLSAQSWAGGDDFAEKAHAIPGFRLILNTPPAPETVFFDRDNRRIRLGDFRGEVVLLNFWATWCKPCIQELPGINALQARLGAGGFKVVAVASGAQMGKTPESFLADHRLDALELYHDPHAAMMNGLGTKTLPSSFLIDRQGRIVGGVIGETDWGSTAAEHAVSHLMR
jgi:thiol-disulfide isomerase/thioredoxin